MKLHEQLEKLDKKELIAKAKKHKLYFEYDFSKTWIIKKIKDRLLRKKYLKKLISNHLSSECISIIKEIIGGENLSNNKINFTILKALENKLFIYQKNNEFIIADDLKTELSKLLFNDLSNTKSNTNTQEETEDIIVNSKKQLPFFFYVLLGAGKIKKLETKDNINSKEYLYSFLSKINTSTYKDKKFYEIIIDYSKKTDLIAEHKLKLSKNFKYWLKESYHQKILNLVKIFFPNYNKILRQIIAVLSKYPKEKTISNSFLSNELNIEPFSKKNKQLLELFDIINFSPQKLKLSDFCWEVFTKNHEFIQPTISKNNVIVSRKANLSLLWFITNNTSLVKIDNKLIFEIKHKKEFLADYNNLLVK